MEIRRWLFLLFLFYLILACDCSGSIVVAMWPTFPERRGFCYFLGVIFRYFFCYFFVIFLLFFWLFFGGFFGGFFFCLCERCTHGTSPELTTIDNESRGPEQIMAVGDNS
jgi:hypothetical protein